MQDVGNRTLFEAIGLATIGLLHLNFAHQVFIEKMRKITIELKGMAFPLDLKEIAERTVMYMDQQLIYRLNTPLVEPGTFALYEVTALPTPTRTGLMTYLWPRIPFIALDSSEKEYITLSSIQDLRCKRTKGALPVRMRTRQDQSARKHHAMCRY